MKLPEQFEVTLNKDRTLHGSVLLTLEEFKPWLDANRLPFFPEYTDHSSKHVEQVLATADALIRDEARSILTPADIATLVLAILVHDSGMHLSEDGFLALLQPEAALLADYGDKPWLEIYEEFIAEAFRFDGRKLQTLFGTTDPIHRPPPDPQKWTRAHYLLIGEFLRRYHHRLAHEIAVAGVPGPTEEKLAFKNVPEYIANFAGLIARSHGQSLRKTIDMIPRDDRREYRGIRAPFLMTILRIADYIQVQSERAPRQQLQVSALKSPLSKEEWKVHHAIEDIRNSHDDPEALYIKARPDNVQTYLKLENLFNNIQAGLDASWAVLGELYGRFEGLNPLGLVIRRIRSNLDDKEAFAQEVSYIPEKVAFNTAGADLLKLLIKPLYGDEPKIGIRELLQNAVDACRELEDYLGQNPHVGPVEQADQEADVVISLEADESGGGWLTVSDKGIGMTADTVRDYFLRAGASFRESDAWRKAHETAQGRSRVLRSGRFGVGALAAFLLGDKITVITRHASKPKGEAVTFTCSVEDEMIELRRTDASVGTTVRVRIEDGDVWRMLSSFLFRKEDYWYCLKEPSVVWKMLAEKTKSPPCVVPSACSTLPTPWRRIEHQDYKDIHWTYENVPQLLCNGIIVKNRYSYSRDEFFEERPENIGAKPYHLSFQVKIPNVSVFDPDGKLPLNLQRTELTTQRLPFHEELYRDVAHDIIAYLLVNTPNDLSRGLKGTASSFKALRHPGITWRTSGSPKLEWLWLAPEGLSITIPWAFHSYGYRRLLLVPSYGVLKRFERFETPLIQMRMARKLGKLKSKEWFRNVMERGYSVERTSLCSGSRALIADPVYKYLWEDKNLPKKLKKNVTKEWSKGGWTLLRTGTCLEPSEDLLHIASKAPNDEHPIVAEWYLNLKNYSDSTSPIAEAWKEVVGASVIPYDPLTREKTLANAYNHLQDYINRHRELREQKKRQQALEKTKGIRFLEAWEAEELSIGED